jgi:hypothetical protein
VFVLPPGSQLGPITPAQRQALVQGSLVAGVYEQAQDRESAYEILSKREEIAAKEAEKLAKLEAREKEAAAKAKARGKTTTTRSRRMTTTERAASNAASTASREITRYILRGIFGTRKR